LLLLLFLGDSGTKKKKQCLGFGWNFWKNYQLLGKSSGFQVAATHRPCTKGLWMWSTPIKRTAADGSEYSLVLLDSEGIDSYDQTVIHLFFSLCLSLSSPFPSSILVPVFKICICLCCWKFWKAEKIPIVKQKKQVTKLI
jgi:hypothetical protein